MKVAEIITNKILESLESGTIPWQKPWQSLRPISMHNRPYTGINRLLLSFAPFSDPRYGTFRHISELGGKVKAGEKGNFVVFWKPAENRKDETTDETTKTFAMLRYYYIFNADQTEGLNLKPIGKQSEFNPVEKAEEIIANWQDKPNIQFGACMEAGYTSVLDTVLMPTPNQFKTTEDYYCTLFHELIHATGRGTRLNRFMADGDRKEKYCKEELVAEIGASFLMAELGMDRTIETSADYIKGYAKLISGDKTMIISAASKAQKAVEMIMGKTAEAKEEEKELVAA